MTVPRRDRFVAIDRAECWLHLQIRYPIVIVATAHEWQDIPPLATTRSFRVWMPPSRPICASWGINESGHLLNGDDFSLNIL